jgi:hypothetical protein
MDSCELDEWEYEISDGPCMFLKNYEGNSGGCVSKSLAVRCEIFENKEQCEENEYYDGECMWSDTKKCVHFYYKYYIKSDGEDSRLCNSYSKGCKTLDYVMQYNVNITGRISTVYIESGGYDFDYFCGDFLSYRNCNFSVIGYISSSLFSSVLADDISTYPIITCTNNSYTYYVAFRISSNCNVFFEYLNFFLIDEIDNETYVFMGLFFLYYFYLFSFFFFSLLFLFIFFLFFFFIYFVSFFFFYLSRFLFLKYFYLLPRLCFLFQKPC